MSLQLINDYLAELDRSKRSAVAHARHRARDFKDLSKAWGRQQGLVFVAEYPVTTTTKTQIVADGALLQNPTIRALFDTDRFADYKEKVVDLLARVTTVSVRTVAITDAMRDAPR